MRWRWSRPTAYWRAKQALSRLQPEWDVGEAGKVDSEQLSQDVSRRAQRAHADRAQRRQCRSGHVGRGQDLRGHLRDALSVAFADGADECDRAICSPTGSMSGSERRRPTRRSRRRRRPPA